MSAQRPRTFIGSSSEGVVVAKAMAANLEDVTQCKLWSEGVFLPGHHFIETLEKLLGEVDYAILVASPDDLLVKRGVEKFTMRDNILLELGLFMARLGRKRTYLVTPQDKELHIPSDLLGVQTVTYAWIEGGDEAAWAAALDKPTNAIKQAMAEAEKELSLATRRMVVKRILAWTTRVHELLAALHIKSARSLLDRAEFDRLRGETARQVARMVEEHRADAELLGASEQYDALAAALIETIETLPFPEEAVVSEGEVVGGVLGHLFGRASIQQQVRTRVDSLLVRYNDWWRERNARISGNLVALQARLVESL